MDIINSPEFTCPCQPGVVLANLGAACGARSSQSKVKSASTLHSWLLSGSREGVASVANRIGNSIVDTTERKGAGSYRFAEEQPHSHKARMASDGVSSVGDWHLAAFPVQSSGILACTKLGSLADLIEPVIRATVFKPFPSNSRL